MLRCAVQEASALSIASHAGDALLESERALIAEGARLRK
jgi:hypothetical protein